MKIKLIALFILIGFSTNQIKSSDPDSGMIGFANPNNNRYRTPIVRTKPTSNANDLGASGPVVPSGPTSGSTTNNYLPVISTGGSGQVELSPDLINAIKEGQAELNAKIANNVNKIETAQENLQTEIDNAKQALLNKFISDENETSEDAYFQTLKARAEQFNSDFPENEVTIPE